MDSADSVEMKIIAAIGRGDAPRRQFAVEGNTRADLIRSRAENLSSNLRRGGFMSLTAIGRAQMQGQGAVLFEFDGGAVDTAGAGRLFHLGEDRHVAGGVPSAGFNSDDDADAHELSLFARFLLFVA